MVLNIEIIIKYFFQNNYFIFLKLLQNNLSLIIYFYLNNKKQIYLYTKIFEQNLLLI